jgi:diguanylate cyclase
MTPAMGNRDEWRAVYERIGGILFEGELEPTSSHYDLCRRYVTRSDSELARSVDEAIARHGALTPSAAATLLALYHRGGSVDEALQTARAANDEIGTVAAIVKRSSEESREYARTLDEGAVELSNSGSVGDTLQRLIAVSRTMSERASAAEEELRAAQGRIEELNERLADVSRTANSDSLTGLPNRRALEHRLNTAFEQAKADGSPLALAICDIDHFKTFNDSFGHDIGDEVIKFVAETLSQVGENRLFVARYGGEEFVVVFDNTTVEAAAERLNKIRTKTALRELSVKSTGQSLGRVTFSAGIAGMEGRRNPSAMLKAADLALYRAKEEGRNRVCVAE